LEADGTGATGVNSSLSSAAIVRHSISLKSASLIGDGIHGMDLIGPDGRVLAHSKAGQALDISHFPRGMYVARCGKEVIAVPYMK
jgi:hypothetical protein